MMGSGIIVKVVYLMDYELETDEMVAFNFHFVSDEERDLPVTSTRSSMQENIPATEISEIKKAEEKLLR